MYLIALISFITLISTLFIKEGLDPRQIEEIKALEEKQNKAFEEEKVQERWKFFVPGHSVNVIIDRSKGPGTLKKSQPN
jgi:hypothetical protein